MEAELLHNMTNAGQFLIAAVSMALTTELLSKPMSWASRHIEDPIDRITACRCGVSSMLALVSIFSLKLSGIDESGYISNGVILGLSHPFISALIQYDSKRNLK